MERLRVTVATAIVLLGVILSGIVAHGTRAAVRSNPNGALNGVYRVQYTAKELLAFGTTAEYAKGNYGVSTLRLTNGRYRYTNSRSASGCSGSYSVSGKRVTFDFNVLHCHGIVKATWTRPPGYLRFRVIVASDPGDAKVFGSKPWKKIG